MQDPSGALSLNHFAIYLMLKQDEIARYGDKLKNINRYPAVTKGIYHFYIVEKGKAPYIKLPEKLYHNMYHSNVLVRLVNFIHGINCYGLDELDFEEDKPLLVDRLKAFVENVCEVNIHHLDILCGRHSKPSIDAMCYYREHQIVKELFESALKGEVIDKDNGKSTLQRVSNGTDLKTSLGLAKFAASGRSTFLDSQAEKVLCQRIKPDYRPQIRVNIKYVNTGKVRKDGSEEKKLGVELDIDGNIVPVCFGSTDPTFLYIITLMAILEDGYIERSFFRPYQQIKLGIPSIYHKDVQTSRKKFVTWLEKRFKALAFNRRFDSWYSRVKDDPHPLDVAMGRIRQTLWDALRKNFKDAYYYCVINNDDGYYLIRIDKDNICIDPKILERITAN